MSVIPDWRVLITQGLGFILVLLIFWRFLWGPILGILESRRKEVDSYYLEAEEDRQAAADLKTQYEQHLARIEAEARAKIVEASKEGQALREEILADSRKQADVVLTKAQEEILRERDKALVELKSRVADIAVNAASKLVEERLDAAKHRELIGKFIDDLEGASK